MMGAVSCKNQGGKLQKGRCVAERFSDTAAFSFLAAAYRIRPSPPIKAVISSI
jgi:hypothetical protein